MTATTTINWMEAMVDAARELGASSLGFETGEVISTSDTMPDVQAGSCVALAGDEESLQVGMAASLATCMQLARRFCMLEPEDEDLDQADLSDVLGEIVNVLAGGMKTRIAEQAQSMSIGLPLVLYGPIEVPATTEIAVSNLRWEDQDVQLWLLHHRKGN